MNRKCSELHEHDNCHEMLRIVQHSAQYRRETSANSSNRSPVDHHHSVISISVLNELIELKPKPEPQSHERSHTRDKSRTAAKPQHTLIRLTSSMVSSHLYRALSPRDNVNAIHTHTFILTHNLNRITTMIFNVYLSLLLSHLPQCEQ